MEYQITSVALQRRLIFPLVIWHDRVTQHFKTCFDQKYLIRCRNLLVVRDILKSTERPEAFAMADFVIDA